MMPLPDNNDLICYYVTKHSAWRGKYKRIFSIGSCGISTYDPDTFELTNTWHYNDVICLKACGPDFKFSITFKKDRSKKNDFMTFSTEHRSELITYGYKNKKRYGDNTDVHRYDAHKFHWSGVRLPVILDCGPVSLDQLDAATNHVLASYPFKDIESISDVTDVPGGFIVSCAPFARKHLFICGNREEIKDRIRKNASAYLSVEIKSDPHLITLEEFSNVRMGDFSNDEDTTSLIEFNVDKVGSPRHKDSALRLLCLTPKCLLERDPETYHIVTLRPLRVIYALVRSTENPREFTIEYQDGSTRSYQAANRDSLLATLLEAIRTAGNRDVHVKIRPSDRGKRFGPYYVPLEEEIESLHLKLLRQASGKMLTSVIERFNSNVPYSGLTHSVTQEGLFKENKEKPIIEALLAVISKQKEGEYDPTTLCDEEVEALFQTLRRLFASKAGFASFTQISNLREGIGNLVVKALNRSSEAVTHAAIDMICALMHPMHEDCDLKQEQLNKSSLLGNSSFLNHLLDMWVHFVSSGSGALVVAAMLDILTFALCLPYSETTEGKNFDGLLDLVAKRGRYLFKLFQHPCVTIVKGASMVMKAIVEEGESEVARQMQDLALSEGALPRHLISALFTHKSDHHRLAQCRISRQLVGLWLTENEKGHHLLQRMLPVGLLVLLDSSDPVPVSEPEADLRDNLKLAQVHANKNQRSPQVVILEKQLRVIEKQLEEMFVHWGARLGVEKRQDRLKLAPVVLRKSRQRIKSSSNWPLFYYNFNLDHTLPNLLWNHRTREELRNALEKEVRAFETDRELASGGLIAWNYSEFEVTYPSLKDQLCIDGYYIKILLDQQEAPESLWNLSPNFFNNLYHRFLLPTSLEMKCMCLQTLSIVYGRFHEQIGFFPDTKYIINMLDKTIDRLERDRLVHFIYKLTKNRENVKQILASGGVVILVDLMTLAHLHTSRAVVPTQSNVIEAGDMKREEEKEWHYCFSTEDRHGPASFREMQQLIIGGKINGKTKCWAQGMEGWSAVQNVPQLKWSSVAKGVASMNESDLTILILNIFISMSEYFSSRNEQDAVIWPMSRLKQYLSSPQCLPHIVQLLLTFDPIIVEKVATLLCFIAKDNVLTPKLYLTGVFYFILMYTGSNVLPIARFLQLTHTKQSFRGEEARGTELMQRSILGQLLPEAMVHYLENHGAEKFAHIFLGEFDTPEAIWSSAMRTMLIQKIAAHLADFTPRLCSNNRAQYQYASIPVIRYPQLDKELFCNVFYLRHLCDSTRFPDWPINDPVNVMRDVLEAWKGEVEKKPPVMSVDEAYTALEVATGQHHDEPTIRKAYYRLAQKYHPDKNPEGREKFEMVNKAYEFLCSRSSWADIGINLNNILLILQTQSILFKRHSTELQPYKYAGYNQLVKTIELEMSDDALFSKKIILLPSAIELIYYSIKCSTLNAEELNRENGFQMVLSAFGRCVSVLSDSTKDNDAIAQICLHCTRCFSIASKFPNCLNTFVDLPQLVADLIRILHFKGLVLLCGSVVECISCLASETKLRQSFFQEGALWYLISFMFSYDFTLEECGIERSQEANQQEAMNELAKLSVTALASLSRNSQSSQQDYIKRTLEKLLTPFLTNMLFNENPHEVLKLMTSNSENPYLLWDNSTRVELLEFLESQKTSHNLEPFEDFNFSFSSHSEELVIGNIFVRIYNEQPSYLIENPKGFVIDLLDFIKKIILDENYDKTKLISCLESLNNVVSHNPGVEIQMIGSFSVFFYLLRNDSGSEIHKLTLSLLSLVTRNQDCISDIAATGVLVYLLMFIYSVSEHTMLALEVLYALASSSAIIKDLLLKGGVVYLLNIIVSSSAANETKIRAAEVLGRLCDDKVSGPRVRLLMQQFLPPAICDATRDTPSSAVSILQTDQENPEIIWNEQARKSVSQHLSQKCRSQYEAQLISPDTPVKPAEKGSFDFNELVVGGVYIRLFNQNPNWSVRKPVAFLTELMDCFVRGIPRPREDLEQIGLALRSLLQAQPSLADHIPSLGHLSKMCSLWHKSDHSVCKLILGVINSIANNESCVNSLVLTDCLSPLKRTMSFPDLFCDGCDVVAKLFSFRKESLVKQALEVGLVTYLVESLSGRMPPRSKALIVQALKSMASGSLAVRSKLDHCPVWADYRDQNHDLFISAEQTGPACLTGVPPTAGYLTQAASPLLPSVPPPLDSDI